MQSSRWGGEGRRPYLVFGGGIPVGGRSIERAAGAAAVVVAVVFVPLDAGVTLGLSKPDFGAAAADEAAMAEAAGAFNPGAKDTREATGLAIPELGAAIPLRGVAALPVAPPAAAAAILAALSFTRAAATAAAAVAEEVVFGACNPLRRGAAPIRE